MFPWKPKLTKQPSCVFIDKHLVYFVNINVAGGLRLKKLLSSWCFKLLFKVVLKRLLRKPILYALAEVIGKVALFNRSFQIIEKNLISIIINALVNPSEGFCMIYALLPSTSLEKVFILIFIWLFTLPKIGPSVNYTTPFTIASTVLSLLYVLKDMIDDTVTNTNM